MQTMRNEPVGLESERASEECICRTANFYQHNVYYSPFPLNYIHFIYFIPSNSKLFLFSIEYISISHSFPSNYTFYTFSIHSFTIRTVSKSRSRLTYTFLQYCFIINFFYFGLLFLINKFKTL